MIGYDLASNKRSSDALGNIQDDASKRARHQQVNGPSRVIHARNLPADCSENDLLMIASPFGRVVNVLTLKGKSQAFIQMQDLLAASSLVEFYSINPCMIRTNTVYLQYSNREEITAPSANAGGGGGGGFSNRVEAPNTILLATVSNLVYPTSVDVLHQIFSKYGSVLKIVTFNKNGNFQALIQFQDLAAAIAAKASLDGQNIYVGCCTLRIQFSSLTQLEVKYNNEKSRDFTNPLLPSGSGGASSSAQATQTFQQIDPTTGQIYITQVPTGYPAAPMQGMGGATGGVGLPGGGGNAVLIVSGLNQERVAPDTLFTLFGVYGDVQRVKILFNKKDTALVQMANPQQAEMVLMHLNGAVLYGSALRINMSKHQSIFTNKNPNSEEESAKYTKDYSTSNAHRYKLAGSKNYQHICPPAATLHISGIPTTVNEQTIRALFGQFGVVVGFKYFVNDKKMALIQMSNVSEAIEALIALHDHKIDETQQGSIKVSFAKSTIV